jgi:hypothetical protein
MRAPEENPFTRHFLQGLHEQALCKHNSSRNVEEKADVRKREHAVLRDCSSILSSGQM